MTDSTALYPCRVFRKTTDSERRTGDLLCVEEPLLISLQIADQEPEPLLSIMRTPGDDIHLVRGFLKSEGFFAKTQTEYRLEHSLLDGKTDPNHVRVFCSKAPEVELVRRFSMNSSCGLCGRLLLDDLDRNLPQSLPSDGPIIKSYLLHQLGDLAREQQPYYQSTGASHGATLFSPNGDLISSFEDIGRHNAVDKVIGYLLAQEQGIPSDSILLVSGRASYELVQKTIMAGIPILVSVGAPSSMALKMAQRFDLTLVGFLRSSSYTVYQGLWRIDREH